MRPDTDLTELWNDEEPRAASDDEDLPRDEIVAIARRLELTFDAPAGAVERIQLAVGVDTSRWVSATLVAVLHEAVGWVGNPFLYVLCKVIQLDPLDPDVVFDTHQIGVDGAEFEYGPALQVVSMLSTLATQVAVEVLWDQRDEDSTGPQRAVLSVYLHGRYHAHRA